METIMSDLKTKAAWRVVQMSAACLLVSVTVTAGPDAPKFDGRGWTVGHQQQNDRQSITEYVLPGQNVENWKELVTSEVFFRPMSITAAVAMFQAKLSRDCPSLVFAILRQDDQTAVIEWRDSGCGGFEASSELARFTIEKSLVYRLAYSAKGSMRPERRKEWLAILQQVPLAEGTARVTTREASSEAQDPEQAARMAKVAQILAGVVRQNGHDCTTPKVRLTEQIPGPAGPMSEWELECAESRFTIWVQPNGAMSIARR
jgi:hypothetical protein